MNFAFYGTRVYGNEFSFVDRLVLGRIFVQKIS